MSAEIALRRTNRRDRATRADGAVSKSGRIDSAELDARILVGAVLGLDLTGMIAAADRPLTADESTRLEDFARRRLAGEPVARILGRQGILGTAAATLGRDAGAEARHRNGGRTGAGNAARRAAIRIAACASPTSAPARARFCWRCCPNCRMPMGSAPTSAWRRCERQAPTPSISNWTDRARLSSPATMRRRCRAPFDLIVSNPPYIRSAEIAGLATEVRDHDPHRALDGGADGLDAYRALIPQAARLLAPGGALVVEVGHGQSARYRGIDDGGRVNAGAACPGPIWRASGGPSRAENCPHKARLECKKTTWNIPRERLRSAHNIGPGLLAP